MKKEGLIKVLLSKKGLLMENESDPRFEYEFFQNYFNSNCREYLKYMVDNGLIDTIEEILELSYNISCEDLAYVYAYMKDPEGTLEEIKSMFKYDLVDNGKNLVLDSNDLSNIIRPDYIGRLILDETEELFPNWFEEVNDEKIENILSEEEKEKLRRVSGLEEFNYNELSDEVKDELKTFYAVSWKQVAESESRNKIMSDIKRYFKTDKIEIIDGPNEELLSIGIDNFFREIIHKYLNSSVVEDNLLDQCSNFFCFLTNMIEDGKHENIYTIDLDLFTPDEIKVEREFHNLFKSQM